ncbi:DNA utilization protein GntX [Siccibacter colletis]|uniref:DNA utilization protein GntX n=1 Tax=Siccibacter colletis TaxID=1505757 RepID=A0ABY6JEP6_9ENTR|nr:DNA utilization protein GntX [Siccibacter colletis]UYU32194.1 DNA utilization protein GntX [Siccibacter colletis]
MLSVPGLCWLCHLPLRLAQWGICSCCAAALRALPCLCPRCGLPSAHARHACGRCLQTPPPWERLVCVSDYAAPLSGLVQHFKFHNTPALAPALARLLALRVLAARRESGLGQPDMMVCVPLHRRRGWSRGYNQSHLLAAWLSARLCCDYAPDALTRVRPAAVQHQLSARLRKNNLKNAFRLELPVAGRHMVIVDDVVTTGSTVAEITRLLKRNGAATVQVWCLCRTL